MKKTLSKNIDENKLNVLKNMINLTLEKKEFFRVGIELTNDELSILKNCYNVEMVDNYDNIGVYIFTTK